MSEIADRLCPEFAGHRPADPVHNNREDHSPSLTESEPTAGPDDETRPPIVDMDRVGSSLYPEFYDGRATVPAMRLDDDDQRTFKRLVRAPGKFDAESALLSLSDTLGSHEEAKEVLNVATYYLNRNAQPALRAAIDQRPDIKFHLELITLAYQRAIDAARRKTRGG